jgi:quinol monooxygenase YgiN
MVRYIMSFKVPENSQHTVQQVVNQYFNELQQSGPGGMRSQCYASHDDQCNFVHIKSFKKESIAHHHFRSAIFRQYLDKLALIIGEQLSFSKLHQQKTFESIY